MVPPHWRQQVPLASLTTWRVGGPAEHYVAPRTRPELLEDLRAAMQLGLPIYLLSRGSNVLIDDRGLPGLVVNLRRFGDREIRIHADSGTIEVPAGVPMPSIAARAATQGLDGFTFLGGIPGSIGAGVAINAGTSLGGDCSLSDVITDIEVVDRELQIDQLGVDSLGLDYRSSRIPILGLIVIALRLQARGTSDPDQLRAELRRHLASRTARQPLEEATAGSVFKRPADGRPAGWYLDRAGMKGCTYGAARISDKHANWIVNLGGASSSDITRLMATAVDRVRQDYGVVLEPEVVELRANPWCEP